MLNDTQLVRGKSMLDATNDHNNKKNKKKRQSRDENYCGVALVIANRSTCLRHNYGAIIVKDNQIISTGYNGAPSGREHCIEIGCIRNKLGIESGTHHEICNGVHAEQNALIQAGRQSRNATLYVTASPCKICSKLIINAKIERVVILSIDDYPDNDGLNILKESGIQIDIFRPLNLPSMQMDFGDKIRY